MRILFLAFSLSLFSYDTLLTEAEKISKKFEAKVSKESPPKKTPLTSEALKSGSSWLKIDAGTIQDPKIFIEESFWQRVKAIGFEAIFFENIRKPNQLSLPKNWSAIWSEIVFLAEKYQIALIGDLFHKTSSTGRDFENALQNIGEYPSLFSLISIPEKDWPLLPEPPLGQIESPITWLELQSLEKKGYIPEKKDPFSKISSWSATTSIPGADGKLRRWVYLKTDEGKPALSWLSASFAAYRILTADALNLQYNLKEKFLQLPSDLPPFAEEMIALWSRKIGSFSISKNKTSLRQLLNTSTDLTYDEVTAPAFLHALISEDAEALSLIYTLFQLNSIEAKSLIHKVEPFDEAVSDWKVFLSNPKQTFEYKQEKVTADVLRQKLLREDILKLGGFDKIKPSTWLEYCKKSLQEEGQNENVEEIQKAHLFLNFAYAMQPGVFSLSLNELLGNFSFEKTNISPLESCDQCLYPTLSCQLKIPTSFASKLSEILSARKEFAIKDATLFDVIPSKNKGSLLLLYKQSFTENLYLLALNFSRNHVKEVVEIPAIEKTNAIEIVTKKEIKKAFSSSKICITLSPISGKAILFKEKNLH